MINPFTVLLGRAAGNPVMQGISQIAGMFQAAQNKQSALNQMAQNNPQMQKVLQYIQEKGGDAKAAFFTYAKENGADPNVAIQQARNMMKL